MQASTFRWTNDMEKLRKSMTFGYGFYGEFYWKEEEAFLIEQFAAKKATNTLCLGSGFFREFSALTQITSEMLMGVDIEEDILHASKDEIVKVNYHTNKLGVGLVTGNILELPIRSNTFDLVVILFQGLGNIPDKKTALQEMLRVCSASGTIIISVWKDDKEITDFRMEKYSLGGKKARIRHNGLSEIIVSVNGIDVFASAVFSDDWFYKAIEEFENVEICSIIKREYCSIVEIKKI